MESRLLVEVAVVGIPDKLMGTQLCALGVAKLEGCSEKEIMAFAAQRLPRHKLPGRIQLLPKLPKNWSAKIDRRECERLAMEFQDSG
jgi:acyl-coenzyme A synthetase/AMP-(fatty) acid ligase